MAACKAQGYNVSVTVTDRMDTPKVVMSRFNCAAYLFLQLRIQPVPHHRRDIIQLAKRDEPPLLLVPDDHAHASQALEQGKSPDSSELRVVLEHFRQPVIRDSAA